MPFFIMELVCSHFIITIAAMLLLKAEFRMLPC